MMHSWTAVASASRTGFFKSSPLAAYPGHPAMMHSRLRIANSFAPQHSGHPAMMHFQNGFTISAPLSINPGHPAMMHSRITFANSIPSSGWPKQPLKSCLKTALSTDSSSIQQKKKTVSFPDDKFRLTQVRLFAAPPCRGLKHLYWDKPKLKMEAMLYAPIRSAPGRFIIKLPRPNSLPRFEARPSIAWSSVRRALAQGIAPMASCGKSSRNVSRPMSKPVNFAPQTVLATSKPQYVFAPASQVAVVRLPPKSSPRQASFLSPAPFRCLSAMVLLLGFCYPDIWTVLLLVFVGYMTIRK